MIEAKDAICVKSEVDLLSENLSTTKEMTFPVCLLGRKNWDLTNAICVAIREKVNNLRVYNNGSKQLFVCLVRNEKGYYVVFRWSGSASEGFTDIMDNMVRPYNISNNDISTFGTGKSFSSQTIFWVNGGGNGDITILENDIGTGKYINTVSYGIDPEQSTQIKVVGSSGGESKIISSIDDKLKSKLSFGKMAFSQIIPVSMGKKSALTKNSIVSIFTLMGLECEKDDEVKIVYYDGCIDLREDTVPQRIVNSTISKIKDQILISSDKKSGEKCFAKFKTNVVIENDLESVSSELELQYYHLVGRVENKAALWVDEEYSSARLGSGMTSYSHTWGENGAVVLPCLSDFRKRKGGARVDREPSHILKNMSCQVKDMLEVVCEIPEGKGINLKGKPYINARVIKVERKTRADKDSEWVLQAGESFDSMPDFLVTDIDGNWLNLIVKKGLEQISQDFLDKDKVFVEEGLSKLKAFVLKHFVQDNIKKYYNFVDDTLLAVKGTLYVLNKDKNGKYVFKELMDEDQELSHRSQSGSVLNMDEVSKSSKSLTVCAYNNESKSYFTNLDHVIPSEYAEKFDVSSCDSADIIFNGSNCDALPKSNKPKALFKITIPKIQLLSDDLAKKTSISPNDFFSLKKKGRKINIFKKNFLSDGEYKFSMPDIGLIMNPPKSIGVNAGAVDTKSGSTKSGSSKSKKDPYEPNGDHDLPISRIKDYVVWWNTNSIFVDRLFENKEGSKSNGNVALKNTISQIQKDISCICKSVMSMPELSSISGKKNSYDDGELGMDFSWYLLNLIACEKIMDSLLSERKEKIFEKRIKSNFGNEEYEKMIKAIESQINQLKSWS
jgi:hypothetical protein